MRPPTNKRGRSIPLSTTVGKILTERCREHEASPILDLATAAQTITELKAEIQKLSELKSLAQQVRRSGEDRKWRELARVLTEEIFTPAGIAVQTTEKPEQPHRIGQTEVCHLWNLGAEETREGEVFRTLLTKLEDARKALPGKVFDVLGKVDFEGRPLRDLLLEAIRYGELPEVRARLPQQLESARTAQLHRSPAPRLQKRMAELKQEGQISALPPVVLGGVLVVPIGLLRRLGLSEPEPAQAVTERAMADKLAVAAEALAYSGLVQSWPEIERLTRQREETTHEQTGMRWS